MKGPSLDAIKKFKEQQELKKREEDERKLKEKFSTLAHRAAQGDRKAKQALKKIEKIQEGSNQPPEAQYNSQKTQKSLQNGVEKLKPPSSKLPQKKSMDFEELMRLAQQNSNQMRRPEEPKFLENSKRKAKVKLNDSNKLESSQLVAKQASKQQVCDRFNQKLQSLPQKPALNRPSTSHATKFPHPARPPRIVGRSRYEDDDEDDYEADDFVVDEEDDDVQDEVSRTIRSVFRYDKRRCDLREEELDRQYRAIGRVSTFEDLEREERRASRLAAAEDAEALREEEERRKRKLLRKS